MPSPTSQPSPVSPSVESAEEVVPDSPSRLVVRNTFIDIDESDASGRNGFENQLLEPLFEPLFDARQWGTRLSKGWQCSSISHHQG